MDWLTTLRRSGGINALSRQLGASPAEVEAGAQVLLPALLGGLRQIVDRRSGGDEGVRALVDALGELGGGQLAADVMGPGPLDTSPGSRIVELVIGPEVTRRAVLIEAERTVGLAPTLGERMLPGLAMLVGGYIAALAVGSGVEGSGGLAGVLESLMPDQNDGDVDRI